MRPIRKIVVHCSATRPTLDVGVADIRRWHQEQGWRDIGYHDVIRRSGAVEAGRPLGQPGAHTKGHNRDSIGICLVGGVGADGRPENNFTPAQFAALRSQIAMYRGVYGPLQVFGHRDLSPDKNGDGKIDSRDWVKACPSFDVRAWLASNP